MQSISISHPYLRKISPRKAEKERRMTQEKERELYTLPDGQERWLTWEEAQAEGFCPACGAFVGGIDSEIPSMSRVGICSECVADIEDEMD